MMDETFIKAKAKINLTLNILGVRSDGDHELESVFQSIYLYDEICIQKSETGNIEIICNNKALETNNIIHKTYSKIKEKYPEITGVIVKLKKKLPMEAGIGGGSSDCAYFIIAMNRLFDLKMTKETMKTLGVSLGADVVPCMVGNTMLGRGIGDKTTYIESNAKYYIILIKPRISISTKEMFKRYDEEKSIVQKNNTKDMIEALEQESVSGICESLYNVFEEIIRDKEEVLECKELLLKAGANGVLMTGSGSAVYGIFESREIAKKTYYEMKKNNKEVYYCMPYYSNKFKELK